MRSFTVKCKICGKDIDRFHKRSNATCFTCKKERYRKYYQRVKGRKLAKIISKVI